MTKDLCERKNDPKVYYRISPIQYIDNKYVKLDDNNIFIRNRQDLAKNLNALPKDYIYWKFSTDGIFRSTSQNNVYTAIIKDVLNRVIEGNDAIILAFGQTGSGKSFTIGGLDHIRQNIGISPRIISDIFELKNKFKQNLKFNLEMSYMEFGSNNAFDLLKEYPNFIEYPYKMQKIKVKDKLEAYTHLYKGEGRKEFISNTYRSNLYSSVLTFFITIRNKSLLKPHQFSSKIHIIDLAGTDSFGNKSCGIKSVKEVGMGNLIKSNLEAFTLYLCENIPETIKVKYRMNPLIQYLGDTLSNKTILRFIGHISLEPENILISLSLLRFGQFIKGIKTNLKEIVPDINKELEVEYYEKEIQKLKDEKEQEQILFNQVIKESIDEERFLQMERCVKEFLENGLSSLDLLNVSEIKATHEIFRGIYREMVIQNEQNFKNGYNKALEDNVTNKIISDKFAESNLIKPVNLSPMKVNSSKFEKTVNSKTNNSAASIKSSRNESKKSLKSVESNAPNEIPDFNEVWNNYVKDDSTNYKQLIKEYQNNEGSIKEIYAKYREQIKLLQHLRELVKKREQECEQFKLLNETLLNNEKSLLDCINNLNCSKEEYTKQLDKTLTCKTNLEVNLKIRSDLKKNLDNDFALYSRRLYNEEVSNFENNNPLADETIELENIDKDTSECEEQSKGKAADMDAPFEKLKLLTNLEIKKKQLYLKTHKSFK